MAANPIFSLDRRQALRLAIPFDVGDRACQGCQIRRGGPAPEGGPRGGRRAASRSPAVALRPRAAARALGRAARAADMAGARRRQRSTTVRVTPIDSAISSYEETSLLRAMPGAVPGGRGPSVAAYSAPAVRDDDILLGRQSHTCRRVVALSRSSPQAPPPRRVISDEHGAHDRKRAGLENRCSGNPATEGSNPSPSASRLANRARRRTLAEREPRRPVSSRSA